MTELIIKKGRNVKVISNDEQLMSFAKTYNSWKNNGFYPVEIRDIITEALDISATTYYKYLRLAREKGFITDTYKENMEKSIEVRRLWLLAHHGNIKGVKFFFPKRIMKGSNQDNDKSAEESTSWLKNICKRFFKR